MEGIWKEKTREQEYIDEYYGDEQSRQLRANKGKWQLTRVP